MESSLKKSAIQQLKLRFFDLEANIQSDSSTYIHLFAQMYRRFRANGAPAPVQPPVEFALLTHADNAWGQPVVILNGDIWPLKDPKLLAGHVCQSFVNAILARVRSHFLIHAGVVAYGGQGIVLAADPFHGKTTLVLELVRRGFKFLSDETAALGRADRWVHPFPRSLKVRPGTLELAGFPEAAAGAPAWLGKWLLDIEEIQPDSIGQAAPISHIVILQDPAEEGEERSGRPERVLGVLVDHLDDSFLTAVRQIEGATEVRTDVHHGYPLLKLRALRRTFVFSQIEALCQEHRVLVLDVVTGPLAHPTFEASARLEAIPRSQAVMELLRRFQGGHKSAILQDEFGGSSARLFMELAALAGQANCHQLFVGPLHEMADLVCGLVGASK